jgi:hypothetical protein
MNDWIRVLQEANAMLMDAVLRNTIDERRKSICLLMKDDLSKEINNTISNISESAEVCKAQLRDLVALPGNNLCSDCSDAGLLCFFP